MRPSDKPFDWVAALAFASSAAVMIPSIAALAIAVFYVVILLFY